MTNEDEEQFSTLENFIFLTGLKLIHHELSKFVKQRYRTKLRSRTLASIKPKSQSHTSLLDKIRTADGTRIMCTAVKSYRKPTGSSPYKGNTPPSHPTTQPPNHPARSYPLCKQGSKPDRGHFLSECSFLAEQYIAKARQIADIFDDPLNLGADLGR